VPPVDRWARLGEAIRAERIRLGYRSLGAFAARVGVSPGTVGNLERGARDRYQPETLAAVEAALAWSPGSVDAILKGGKATREADEDLAAVLAAWPRLDRRARRALRAAAEALRR
jgi:transcriptional regulator with XRE-family HTH domain